MAVSQDGEEKGPVATGTQTQKERAQKDEEIIQKALVASRQEFDREYSSVIPSSPLNSPRFDSDSPLIPESPREEDKLRSYQHPNSFVDKASFTEEKLDGDVQYLTDPSESKKEKSRYAITNETKRFNKEPDKTTLSPSPFTFLSAFSRSPLDASADASPKYWDPKLDKIMASAQTKLVAVVKELEADKNAITVPQDISKREDVPAKLTRSLHVAGGRLTAAQAKLKQANKALEQAVISLDGCGKNAMDCKEIIGDYHRAPPQIVSDLRENPKKDKAAQEKEALSKHIEHSTKITQNHKQAVERVEVAHEHVEKALKNKHQAEKEVSNAEKDLIKLEKQIPVLPPPLLEEVVAEDSFIGEDGFDETSEDRFDETEEFSFAENNQSLPLTGGVASSPRKETKPYQPFENDDSFHERKAVVVANPIQDFEDDALDDIQGEDDYSEINYGWPEQYGDANYLYDTDYQENVYPEFNYADTKNDYSDQYFEDDPYYNNYEDYEGDEEFDPQEEANDDDYYYETLDDDEMDPDSDAEEDESNAIDSEEQEPPARRGPQFWQAPRLAPSHGIDPQYNAAAGTLNKQGQQQADLYSSAHAYDPSLMQQAFMDPQIAPTAFASMANAYGPSYYDPDYGDQAENTELDGEQIAVDEHHNSYVNSY